MNNLNQDKVDADQNLRGSALRKELDDKANWLQTIGFFGVVNVVLVSLGINLRFIFTLSITDLGSSLAVNLFPGLLTSLTSILGALLVYLATYNLARFARRGHAWAFQAGAVVYTIDMFFWFLLGNYIEVAAHAFVLFQLSSGKRACDQLVNLGGSFYRPRAKA